MKKRLAVVGVGSAGILSLCHFLTWLHNDWEIVSIYDPSIPILGIGESSNPSFVEALENAFGFDLLNGPAQLDATRKYGTMWKEWNGSDFLGPLYAGNCAIHFDTFKLKEYVLPKLQERWPEKFKVLEGKVSALENIENRVRVVVNDTEHIFNYVIDCRGFPTDLETDYSVFENMPINHGLVHNIHEPADWGYTGHRAHKNGWMFEIPLTTRQSYGYMFNDKITSVEAAKEDFAKLINVPVEQLDKTEYKFKSYYSTKVLDGRILKNGNRAGFFEPMSATSIFMYDRLNRLFYNYLINYIEKPDDLNLEFAGVAEAIRQLICWFYHKGSNHDSEFWNKTVAYTNSVLDNSTVVKRVKESFDKCLDSDVPALAESWFFNGSQLYYLDKKFGFGEFS